MTAQKRDFATQPYVILAALSFDETGDSALREATQVAEGNPASELHLVHVVVEQEPTETNSDLLSLDKRLTRAPEQIKQRVDALWKDNPRKVIAHLRAGIPARSILQTAVDLDADLIVVGSHQRAGMEKLMLGSVAEHVLRHAHCPVLVAVPKNYAGKTKSQSIEPPCPDCVAMRTKTHGDKYWCERHLRTYAQPHVYEPSPRQRESLMPSQ
jgi:nucleotide-binding universal stress UspA family protein